MNKIATFKAAARVAERIVPERAVIEESLAQTVRDRQSRGEILAVVGLTLTAIALRMLMLKYAGHVGSDEVSYVTLGRNLVSGNFKEAFSAYWPPLYPGLIGILSLATGDALWAGRLVSVLSGGLLIVPVYCLARYLYNRTTGLIAAFFTLVYPVLLKYSIFAMTESLYTLLYTLVLLSGLHAFSNGRRRYFLINGLIIGACYLVRPEAFGFAPFMLVLIGFKLISRRVSRKNVLVNALVFSGGFIILALPYILYLRSDTGGWTLSSKLGAVFFGMESRYKWGGLIEDTPTTPVENMSVERTATTSSSVELQLEDEPQTHSWSRFLERIMESPKLLYQEYTIHLPSLMNPGFIFLAGLGFFAGRWSPHRAKNEAFLLAFVAATLVGYALTGPQTRYLTALVPVLVVWASMGVYKLESFICETEERIRAASGLLRRRRVALRCLLLLVLTLTLAPEIVGLRRPQNADYRDRQVALCVKAQSYPHPRFMAATARMAFFADGRHLYLPNANYEAVIDNARDRKVDFLVVEESFIYRTPELRFLLDDSPPPPGLRLICKDDTPQEKVRVFQLTPSPSVSVADVANDGNFKADSTSSGTLPR